MQSWLPTAVLIAFALPLPVLAAELTAQQAASHVGETATVCGVVASANYSVRTKGQPTFLNLDRAYPQQVFTVLIWGSDRPKFGAPEAQFMGKRLCATGNANCIASHDDCSSEFSALRTAHDDFEEAVSSYESECS